MALARVYIGSIEIFVKDKYEYARVWLGKPDEFLKSLKGKKVLVIVIPFGEKE